MPIEALKDAPNPSHFDVAEACGELGFKSIAIDGKRHPRDQFSGMARVRVELKDTKGALIVPSIPTKEALMKAIAAKIPHLPGRKMRMEQIAAQRAHYERMRAEQAAAAAKAGAGKKAAAGAAGGSGAAAGGKGKGSAVTASSGKGRKGR